MQIKIANYNANAHIMNNISQKSANQFAKVNTGNVFGAGCKVTISHEGRKLSEQASKTQAQKSMKAAKVDRMLIRQQQQQEDYQDEYSKMLDSVNAMIRSVQESSTSAEDVDTIQKKQEALKEMVDLKEQQDKENEQRMKEAESALAAVSKQQAEIDQKNKDLLLLLKSFSDDEDEENGSHNSKHSGESGEEQSSIGEKLGQSASELGISAAKRELQTLGVIQELENDGLGLLSDVRGMVSDINAELTNAKEALQDGSISEEDRKQAAAEYAQRAMDKATTNYADMLRMKAKGLQEKRDANELKTKHIVINPLDDVGRMQQILMDASADAVLREEAQGKMDETSQEIEELIQEEIDKRDHISNGSEEGQTPEDLLQEKLEQEKEDQEALEEKELEKEKLQKEELPSKENAVKDITESMVIESKTE